MSERYTIWDSIGINCEKYNFKSSMLRIDSATSGSLDQRCTDWATEAAASIYKGILKIMFGIYTPLSADGC